MRDYQLPLKDVDPLIKLGEVERALSQVFTPPPSRPTIIEWIEEGTLEGRQIGRGRHWFVYESSLVRFVEGAQEKMAA